MKNIYEIIEQIEKASDIINDENNAGMQGMSYEQGVRIALEWVVENTEDKPIED